MKKFRFLFYTLTLILIFTSCKKSSENDNVVKNTMTSGRTTIAVDQTVQNVIKQVVDMFEALNPAKIEVIYTSEKEAAQLLVDDSVRFAVTARDFYPQEFKQLRDQSFRPEKIRIAIDGIALISNPQNRDTLITVADVQKILTGEITEWKQINPNSKLGKIQVVFDNTNSSIVRYANDSICRDKTISPNLNALQENEEVVQHVAKVPNAIGLIGVNHISNERDSITVDFTRKVRVMHVSKAELATENNSYQPIQYYLYTGDYPFRREIFILLNDPRGELPKGLARFASSPQGQRIIKGTGLLPSTMPIQAVKIVE